jgi:hypothetical protein
MRSNSPAPFSIKGYLTSGGSDAGMIRELNPRQQHCLDCRRSNVKQTSKGAKDDCRLTFPH